MTKKTEILRATKEEARLLAALRTIGVNKVIEELDLVIEGNTSAPTNVLRALKSSLVETNSLTLADLQTRGNISDDDAITLLSALHTDRTIVICGDKETDKSRLMKSLITSAELDRLFTIVKESEDYTITPTASKQCSITIPSDNLSLKDLSTALLCRESNTLVVPKLRRKEDILLLFHAFSYNQPVLFSIDAPSDKVKDTLKVWVKPFKDVVTKTIEAEDMLIVECYLDGNVQKVRVQG